MELSELIVDQRNRLLAFDDRTGGVFWIHRDTFQVFTTLSPIFATFTPFKLEHICSITEGDGYSTSKGQKTEWATIHDNKIYAGSFGKEYVDASDGSILHRNNMWISVLDQDCSSVLHRNWTDNYNRLRLLWESDRWKWI